MKIELPDAIASAKAALIGESYDATHQALADLIEALGQGEIPECTCDGMSSAHTINCPCYEWQEPSFHNEDPDSDSHPEEQAEKACSDRGTSSRDPAYDHEHDWQYLGDDEDGHSYYQCRKCRKNRES